VRATLAGSGIEVCEGEQGWLFLKSVGTILTLAVARDLPEHRGRGRRPSGHSRGALTVGPDVMKMRRALVARYMDVAGKPVLEIGAFDRPLYTRDEVDLRVLDYLTTEELVALAKRTEGRDPGNVPHVDYVARSSLVSQYVDKTFDLIVCNYVMEHVPNLLEWMCDIRKVMNPRGRLLFSLPDRAYTYDYLRHETTVIDLLRAYVESSGKPDFWQILDCLYHYRPVTGVEAWFPEILQERLRTRPYTLMSAVATAKAASALPYQDTHCNVFTRDSFLALMGELGASGLLAFNLDEVTEVEQGTFEFQGILSVDESFAGIPAEIEALRAQKATSGSVIQQSHKGTDPHRIECRNENMRQTDLDVPVTLENFDENAYMSSNHDVKAAVELGAIASGRVHFENAGWQEGRRMRLLDGLVEMRRKKMDRVRPVLRCDLPFTEDVASGGKVNFLTRSLRDETRIVDTENVSGWPYDSQVLAVLDEFSGGMILDCGAGRRSTYYDHVVNYEIVDYDTTDVIGVGEHLPFHDNSFDAVLSLAVLEHVRDPFQCANEISRVLKPGGKLFCTMPFLQPLHGYPHHYFNATHQGLRRLFEDRLEIEKVSIPFGLHPIFALQWIASSWANGLTGKAKQEFLDMRIGEVLADPVSQADKPFVAELDESKRFELACGNLIEARKRA